MLDRKDKHFDPLETRSSDERAADQLVRLNAQLAANGMAAAASLDALAGLPVLRKSDLVARVRPRTPPFGGLPVCRTSRMCSSPPGRSTSPAGSAMTGGGWGASCMRWASGKGDIVQNCFGYHLTPAGHDLRERRTRGGRRRAARRHRADRASGARGARHRGDRLCRHAGLPEGDPRQGRRDGRRAEDRRAAVGGGALFPSCGRNTPIAVSPVCSATPPPISATSPMRARRWRG
jgi:phenylacetate-CoA ligase